MKSFRFYKTIVLNWFSSFSRFSRDTRSVQLTTVERAAVRVTLVECIKDNPVPMPVVAPSTHASFFVRPAFASILLVLGSSWVVAQAAESALPGEVLYPIKVSVVEPLKALTIVSPVAKTQWQIERAKRRLEEVEQLAAQKRLTPELAEVTTQLFTDQAKTIEDSVELFRQQEGAEAATNVYTELEATLKVHADVLRQIASDQKTEEVAALAAIVAERARVTAANRVVVEEDVLSQKRSKLVRAVNQKKDSAQDTVESLDALSVRSPSVFGASVDVQVGTSARAAKDSFDAGLEHLQKGHQSEAFRSFQLAQQFAIEAKVRAEAVEKIGAIAGEAGVVAIRAQAIPSESSAKNENNHLHVLIITDKQKYDTGESVIMTVAITNESDHSTTLDFPTGCQAQYSIDGQSVKPEHCTQVISAVTLPSRGTQQWSFTVAGLSEGKHNIRGDVRGYGSDDITIRVNAAKNESGQNNDTNSVYVPSADATVSNVVSTPLASDEVPRPQRGLLKRD